MGKISVGIFFRSLFGIYLPETSTNFEKPLLTVKDIIKNYKNNKEYEASQITHIFMTDGEVNDGKTELEYIMPLLDNEISFIIKSTF
mgnify:CR=1 FL=1